MQELVTESNEPLDWHKTRTSVFLPVNVATGNAFNINKKFEIETPNLINQFSRKRFGWTKCEVWFV